jgi:excisionase family DNA binding protein
MLLTSASRASGQTFHSSQHYLKTEMSNMNEHSQVLTLKEAAAYLRVSKTHLANVINGKVAGVPRLRHAQVGRRKLIRREWVDKWLDMAGRE